MTPPGRAVRLIVRVDGAVQGVGYRAFAQRRAQALNLDGYARNEPDGSVLVVVEGDRARLERLLAELRQGPIAAHVRTVEESWHNTTGEFAGFQIRY